jgi:hypothetical protein
MRVRSNRRRQPTIEGLEARELLSSGAFSHDPAAQTSARRGHAFTTDPDFGPTPDRWRQQTRAALAYLRVATVVVDVLEGRAVSSPILKGSGSGNIYDEFEKIFGKEENQTVEQLFDAVGPKNPFLGLPQLSEAQLEPGDIIASTKATSTSQLTRITDWSRFSHTALYLGNGMVEDATASGVLVRPLGAMLANVTADGVMRDEAASPAQVADVVSEALKHKGKPYNYPGVAAIANQKLAGLIDAAPHGTAAMIAVLSRAETLPAELTRGDSFWCSQLVLTAYAEAGISFDIANGASPGDLVRLSEGGPLTEIGVLPV